MNDYQALVTYSEIERRKLIRNLLRLCLGTLITIVIMVGIFVVFIEPAYHSSMAERVFPVGAEVVSKVRHTLVASL